MRLLVLGFGIFQSLGWDDPSGFQITDETDNDDDLVFCFRKLTFLVRALVLMIVSLIGMTVSLIGMSSVVCLLELHFF